MYNTHHSLYSYLTSMPIFRVLISILCVTLFFSSQSSYAATCDAGFETDSFSITDYNRLAPISSPPTPRINQPIDGNGTESYLIGSNSLALNGSLTSSSTNIYQSTAVAGSQVFQLFQDYATKNSSRTVSYTFKNRFTNEPQPLDKLSLSIYDIDTNIAGFDSQGRRYFRWFDQVTINGFNSEGALVTAPTVESKGLGITGAAPYRQDTVASSVACSGLDENCKVSVAFTDPVVRVDVIYGNDPTLNYSSNGQANNDPSSQIINIKFDSYCYKPQPRLTYTKALSTPRRENTDQFTVQIRDNADNSVVTNGITTTTTTGSNSVVTNGTGTTGTYRINPTKTYTLTEVASGTTNLSNYSDSYICLRANGTMVTGLNPKNIKLTYGDNWTCTINNSQVYTFSGTVFNDNGGIDDSQADANNANISSGIYSNSNYFNSVFNAPSESGIAGSTVSLVDCRAPSTVYASQAVSSTGSYQINLPVTTVNSNMNNICVIEERNGTDFPIRTTSPSKKIDIVANTFSYPNNNFGRVIAKNVALVLKKSQYINDCPATLNYASINDAPTPLTGFSTAMIEGIAPGRCIAYKITATNRANTKIDNFIMKDVLQKKGTGGALVTSVLANPALTTADYITGGGANSSPAIGENGTVRTKNLVLEPRSKRNFYFNTKYGTSQ